jgi:hypothetical protein
MLKKFETCPFIKQLDNFCVEYFLHKFFSSLLLNTTYVLYPINNFNPRKVHKHLSYPLDNS